MKTGEDFKQAVQALGLKEWVIRECSLCHAPLSYKFIDDKIFFDSNCGCTNYTSIPEERTWNSLANYYNMQTQQKFTDEMDRVFGFKEQVL